MNESLSLEKLVINPPDEAARQRSYDRWNAIAKPIGGLGLLEDDIAAIAALTGSDEVDLSRKRVLVVCADNGVVVEGVSQSDQSITLDMAAGINAGTASVCQMAKVAGADLLVVDVGMCEPVEGVRDQAVARCTGNIARGPAMTRSQALEAIAIGVDLVKESKDQGYRIIATGEMGVGNTTTSAALSCVLLGRSPQEVTGRGSGLTSTRLLRKVEVVGQALEVNEVDPSDTLGILAGLGGFDIAALAGIFIGGALYRVPILIDGVISAVAALIAVRLCPECRQAMLASHVSAEPPAAELLEAIGVEPLVCAGMHLGEGTGAVAAFPLLDMALAVYQETATFEEVDIEAYEVDPK